MKLKDFDAYLGELQDTGYSLFEEEIGVSRLWVSQLTLYLKDCQLKIKEGIYESWDEETKDYQTDHDLYLIFDSQTNQLLYTESGSGLEVCLHNFLHWQEISLEWEDIQGLDCEVLEEY
ncbi:hypothetical protein [Turicibacter sp. TS3]|uniref:hypothetical protein n=1 Tax=Turicibacter sp. TS3 TaxID=2304578 RepID=UPI00137AE0A0|nr:hypothetical protein [Turicibacter sp. TS3]NCE79365.1 hypothetical protein [Turicibacter sp. TS3]